MMLSWCILAALCLVQASNGQLTAHGFNSVHGSLNQPQVIPHRDVIVNAEHEALLPPNLKNPFYKNPRIADALAAHSWFGPGESQVFDRETNHIPRQRIFSVLKNAGLARR